MPGVIELFAVAPHEDAAFLAAWAAEAPPGATLHRALRAEVRRRFASLACGAPDGAGGVLLIVPFDVPAGEDDRFLAAWEAVREVFSARQGYLGAQLLRSPDARFVAVVHWSSPLMYARTVRQEGDVIAALPFPGDAALYVRALPRISLEGELHDEQRPTESPGRERKGSAPGRPAEEGAG